MASRTILHMDMDAFFASVEQLDNPSLRGQCLVVGGASQRGVVAAASYEARKFGIHSAMPIFQAREKCRRLVIVPPRRKRYATLSHRIMDILRSFSPLVEPISIDEAFVDITGCVRLHGSPGNTAMAIKARIKEQIGLTCSVGVAPNKFLAKVASDMHKPDGLTLIEPSTVKSFVQSLPIGKVSGVGRQTQKQLASMGITTLGQVSGFSKEQIVAKLGKFGHRLVVLAQGQDDSPVNPHHETKSVSSEMTLAHDTRSHEELASHLLVQSQSVARQLRRQQLRARTITLIIKMADFRRHTRSKTLEQAIQSSDTIYQSALSLLQASNLSQPVRLVGVGASGLQGEAIPVQQSLFPDNQETHHGKWVKVDQAVDAIANRYGGRTIVRGTQTPSKK